MPSWNQLLDELGAIPPDQLVAWFIRKQRDYLNSISSLRSDSNVMFYGSAWLQKPGAPANIVQITPEDINAFMSVAYGMDWQKPLTLIIHTPGGATNAVETIVAYIRSKFSGFEVIIPTYAMSAGTMISLASDRIIMGRQSQLGPIDPQFLFGNRGISAGEVLAQFEHAKSEILVNPQLAVVWAPILQQLGPSLLHAAKNALSYSENMVANWLEKYMFGGEDNANAKAIAVAAHFNATETHMSHGRRIDREEARGYGVKIEDLEDSQELQEAVLSMYHLTTLGYEKGPATKSLIGNNGRMFIKNWADAQVLQPKV